MRKALRLVAAGLVLAATSDSQTRPAPPASGAPALERLGRISFPTSGARAAQPSFIRGVLLLHSFEYDEAIDAFREAQRVDSRFAMAYWGEAMCYSQPLWDNEEIDKARGALARLAPSREDGAAKAPTPREKGYLDAVEILFGAGDRTVRRRAYAGRMGRLARDYPDDDEAAAFYALALLGTIPAGGRDAAVSLQAGAIASAVLERNPQHPGAAHYALHAYDDGEHAAMGLMAARAYSKIAPASSHALHMPSHIFLPLGLWDEAAASDEASWGASLQWVHHKHASIGLADFHSLSWLHYEYLQQGRFAKARAMLGPVQRAIAELAGANAGFPGSLDGRAPAHQHVESEIGRGFDATSLKNELASMRARDVVESGEWEQMRGHSSFDNIDELFALGLSSVHLGDLARADAAREHLDEAAAVLPDHDASEVAAIMSAELDGMISIALHDRSRGLSALERAASLEASRPRPVGRPYPIKPAAELYAEALLESDAPAAVRQFRRALDRTPNRAAALIGLARAEQSAGLSHEAAESARAFLAIWHGADANRKEAADARTIAERP